VFGCNYAGSSHALHGCINDAHAVYEMLVYAYQFDPQVRAYFHDTKTVSHIRRVVSQISFLCDKKFFHGTKPCHKFSTGGQNCDTSFEEVCTPPDVVKLQSFDTELRPRGNTLSEPCLRPCYESSACCQHAS